MGYPNKKQNRGAPQFERLSRVKELAANIAMRLTELQVTPADNSVTTLTIFKSTFKDVYAELLGEESDDGYDDEEYYDR